MRKNVCYFLLALLCLFAFSGVVNADEQTNKEGVSPSDLDVFKCDSSVKAKGLASAAEVKVAYETVEFKSEKAPNTIFYYVDIYVYNSDKSDKLLEKTNGAIKYTSDTSFEHSWTTEEDYTNCWVIFAVKQMCAWDDGKALVRNIKCTVTLPSE